MSRAWADLATLTMGDQPHPSLTAMIDAATDRTYSPAANVRGLPAVIGAQRLIASAIDQLDLKVDGAPVPQWLARPRMFGGMLDQGDLIQFTVGSMLWHGVGYWRCIRVGQSWRIDAVHPDQVTTQVDTRGVLSVRYQLAGTFISPVPASPWDTVPDRSYLLPIPLTITPDHPTGVSPLQLARESLEGFAATEQTSWDTLTDGTHSGGRLETEQDLAPATAQRYQDKWVDARRHRRIPVLGSGLRYVNDLINPRDAQWVEARAFNQAVVYMMLGIPPDYMGASLVGGQSSMAYANAQDNNRRFRRNCLEGFTTQIADAVTLLLPPGRNADEATPAYFDYTAWEGTPADE